MPATPIRLLLVHDRVPANLPVLRAVEAFEVLEVIGTVWTMERMLQVLHVEAPDLVVVDWLLAAVAASEVCHALNARLLAPRVIVVMPDDDVVHRRGAALAGAVATVSRQSLEAGFARALVRLFPEVMAGRHRSD